MKTLAAALLFVPVLISGAYAEKCLVKADSSLTLREKPDSAGKKIESLSPFDAVEVKKREKDWVQVKSDSGKLGWVMSNYLSARPFVVAEGDSLQVRRGPESKYEVIMKVGKNYPFKILDKGNGWLKVSDFDGDRGWVSAKEVAFNPFVITRRDKTPIRAIPMDDKEIKFTSERGVIYKVLDEKGDWLKVQHSDGDEGWVLNKSVFGWIDNDPEPAKAAKVAKAPTAKPSKPPAKATAKSSKTTRSKSSKKK